MQSNQKNVFVESTLHKIYFGPSQSLSFVEDKSIDLVVTSPPYPMIEMWDEVFSKQNGQIGEILPASPAEAFELMHQELDKVWKECYRVMKDGAFLCINIGDATRSFNQEFQLFSNHTRILQGCLGCGFNNLPNIIWRKPTNSPNKFMGSGMLPCGAYVTLEHEWILIFRKGQKRSYSRQFDKILRRESSYFWEERNAWFSDLWEIRGTRQKLGSGASRERNAAFPLEIPNRLINMYSQRGDVVLDPFVGVATTTVASLLNGRNSVGVDVDPTLRGAIFSTISTLDIDRLNALVKERYYSHLRFIEDRMENGKEVKYYNAKMNCKVMTSQETDMELHLISDILSCEDSDLAFQCQYLPSMPLNADLYQSRDSLFRV